MPDLVSIIVPCYNEAACLPVLLERVEKAMATVADLEYEILVIDDGSDEPTVRVLQQCRAQNPRIGFLRFVRNFGHQGALTAGLEHARGDAVIMMDADLQHPPELLPELLRQWRAGYDVVQALRRTQPGLGKSLLSHGFYLFFNRISEVQLQDGAADFRLLSRRAVDSLLGLPEQSRFLRGLVAWLGLPCTTIRFDAPPRLAGRSSYSFRKMLLLAVEGLVALSSKPLHLALYLAGMGLLTAFLYTTFVLVQRSRGVPMIPGWTSTVFLILIMGSINLFCTGILGMYLRAVLVELRKRPSYLVSQYEPPLTSRHPAAPPRTADPGHRAASQP